MRQGRFDFGLTVITEASRRDEGASAPGQLSDDEDGLKVRRCLWRQSGVGMLWSTVLTLFAAVGQQAKLCDDRLRDAGAPGTTFGPCF